MGHQRERPNFDPSKIRTHVIDDVPGVVGKLPDVPDTPQREHLQRVRSVRQSVFGMQDGIITTLGIVTGVGQAQSSHWFVLVSGIVALVSGSLSMAVGEYLGDKSEQEVVAAAIAQEKSEMENHPQDEFTEQVRFYREKGFTAREAETIVSRLMRNPHVYLHEMTRDEFGVDPREAEGTDYRAVVSMALTFAGGSLLPLLPYFFHFAGFLTEAISLGLATIGLFGIGYYAGTLSNRNKWLKGLEVVMYGAVVFGVTWAAGRYIGPIFGHTGTGVPG